jgi:23S rRNA (cytosine1962-C5)-methyltransferase
MDYELLDSGNGMKFERFGRYRLVRPCAQAVWAPMLDSTLWSKRDGEFSREEEGGWKGQLPSEWVVSVEGLRFKLTKTDFGHLGLFPEHRLVWRWLREQVRPNMRVLNLFAYSGGATLAAAAAGAEVCHVDASRGMVAWARENAALNGLEKAPIRWIVDDAMKFLQREVRRGRGYDLIILDPPSFGRGAKGEIFKIEETINLLLKTCVELLTDEPKGLFFTCHTAGYTPLTLHHLLYQAVKKEVRCGEIVLEGPLPLPCGAYAVWESHA